MMILIDQREVRDGEGQRIELRRRSLNLLMLLAENAGQVVSKEALIQANWSNLTASDESLARCISDIRGALGAKHRHNLRTFPGRGYILEGVKAGNSVQLESASMLTEGLRGAEKSSLAILPFTEVTGDADQAYLAFGIMDDLIVTLSRIRWFHVIGRGSSFAVRNEDGDFRRIGRKLGAHYILDGTLRRDGTRLRLTARLIEAETCRQIWATRFEGELTDVFDLQDRIAKEVTLAIEPNLQAAEIEKARRKRTGDLGAYDLYLRSLPLFHAYTREGFAEAETLLRSALKQDQNYVDALAALADCIGRMALNGWLDDVEEAYAESCRLAERAVLADPEHPGALATAAWASAMFGEKFERAAELADRVLELHPDTPAIRSYCGWVFVYTGQCRRAIEQFEAARKLSPLDPRSYFFLLGLAGANFFLKNFDETIALSRRIILESPSHIIAHRFLAAALALSGKKEDAHTVLSRILEIQPDYSLSCAHRSRMAHDWMMDLWIKGLAEAGLR
jgi:adenylate cyclase